MPNWFGGWSVKNHIKPGQADACHIFTLLFTLTLLLIISSSVSAASVEDFSAYASESVLSGCQCKTFSTIVTITNTGTVASDYLIYVEGSAAPYTELKPNIVVLAPGKTEKVYVYITPPCAFSGKLELVTKIAASTLEKEIYQLLDVASCRNIELKAEKISASSCPCSDLTYNINVRNIGSFVDTYWLNATDFANPAFSENPVTLAPGENKTVQLTVAGPCDFVGVRQFSVVATAARSYQSDSVSLTAYSENCFAYSLELNQLKDKARLCSGETSSHQITIRNNGTLSNLFTLDVVNMNNDDKAVLSPALSPSSLFVNAQSSKNSYLILNPKKIGNYTFAIKATPEKGRQTQKNVKAEVIDCYAVKVEAIPFNSRACCGLEEFKANITNIGISRERFNVASYDNFVTVIPSTFFLSPQESKIVSFNADLPCSTQKRSLSGEVQIIGKDIVKGITFPVEIYSKHDCYDVELKPQKIILDYASKSFDIAVSGKGIRTSTYTVVLDSGLFWDQQKQTVTLEKIGNTQDQSKRYRDPSGNQGTTSSKSLRFNVSPKQNSRQDTYPTIVTIIGSGTSSGEIYQKTIDIQLRHNYLKEIILFTYYNIKPYLWYLLLLIIVLIILISLLNSYVSAKKQRMIAELTSADVKGNVQITRSGWVASSRWRIIRKAGTSASFENPYFEILKVEAFPRKNLYNTALEIKKFLQKPSTVPAADKALSYFSFSKKNMKDKDISYAKIIFKVPTSALKQAGIKPWKVAMLRYKDSWQTTETKYLLSYDGYSYFEAMTPGFSIFAIGKKGKPPVVPVAPSAPRPSVKPVTTLVSAPKSISAPKSDKAVAEKDAQMPAEKPAKKSKPKSSPATTSTSESMVATAIMALLLLLLLAGFIAFVNNNAKALQAAKKASDSSQMPKVITSLVIPQGIFCESGKEQYPAKLSITGQTNESLAVIVKGPSFARATLTQSMGSQELNIIVEGSRTPGLYQINVSVYSGNKFLTSANSTIKIVSCYKTELKPSFVNATECCGTKKYTLNLSNKGDIFSEYEILGEDWLIPSTSFLGLSPAQSRLIEITAIIPCGGNKKGYVRAIQQGGNITYSSFDITGLTNKDCYKAVLISRPQTLRYAEGQAELYIKNVGKKSANYTLAINNPPYWTLPAFPESVALSPNNSKILTINFKDVPKSVSKADVGITATAIAPPGAYGLIYYGNVPVSFRTSLLDKLNSYALSAASYVSKQTSKSSFYNFLHFLIFILLVLLILVWAIRRKRKYLQNNYSSFSSDELASETSAVLPTVRRKGIISAYVPFVTGILSEKFCVKKVELLTNSNNPEADVFLTRIPLSEVHSIQSIHNAVPYQAYHLQLNVRRDWIEKIQVWFTIDRQWLANNTSNSSNGINGIFIFKKNKAFKAELIASDSDKAYYRATIDSLGYFLIGSTGTTTDTTLADKEKSDKLDKTEFPRITAISVVLTMFLILIVLIAAIALYKARIEPNSLASGTGALTGTQTGSDAAQSEDLGNQQNNQQNNQSNVQTNTATQPNAKQDDMSRKIAEAEVSEMLKFIEENNLSKSFYYHVWNENTVYTINLSKNIFDPDMGQLNFSASPVLNITSKVKGGIVIFTPDKDFIGVRKANIYVQGSNKSIVTDDITLVVKPKSRQSNENILKTLLPSIVAIILGIVLILLSRQKAEKQKPLKVRRAIKR